MKHLNATEGYLQECCRREPEVSREGESEPGCGGVGWVEWEKGVIELFSFVNSLY